MKNESKLTHAVHVGSDMLSVWTGDIYVRWEPKPNHYMTMEHLCPQHTFQNACGEHFSYRYRPHGREKVGQCVHCKRITTQARDKRDERY